MTNALAPSTPSSPDAIVHSPNAGHHHKQSGKRNEPKQRKISRRVLPSRLTIQPICEPTQAPPITPLLEPRKPNEPEINSASTRQMPSARANSKRTQESNAPNRKPSQNETNPAALLHLPKARQTKRTQ